MQCSSETTFRKDHNSRKISTDSPLSSCNLGMVRFSHFSSYSKKIKNFHIHKIDQEYSLEKQFHEGNVLYQYKTGYRKHYVLIRYITTDIKKHNILSEYHYQAHDNISCILNELIKGYLISYTNPKNNRISFLKKDHYFPDINVIFSPKITLPQKKTSEIADIKTQNVSGILQPKVSPAKFLSILEPINYQTHSHNIFSKNNHNNIAGSILTTGICIMETNSNAQDHHVYEILGHLTSGSQIPTTLIDTTISHSNNENNHQILSRI